MGYELSNYSNLNKWFTKLQSLPSFDENRAGAKAITDYIKSITDEPFY
jgi:hypothetical protein